MNILLLGNGFDINYCLPTKYINFLHTVAYIGGLQNDKPATVGDVFGAAELQAVDEDIARSYQKYARFYDKVNLESSVIQQLKKVASDNIWFEYLSKLVYKDIGWIDFEKEIGSVLVAFGAFRKDGSIRYSIDGWNGDRTICKTLELFNFFSRRCKNETYRVTDEYIITNPIVKDIKRINHEKIADYLEQKLIEFANGLKEYLRCFVDDVVLAMSAYSEIPVISAFEFTDTVITFNYTKTFEHLYEPAKVFHIHGDVHSRIVLGLNPDESDKIQNIDTTFLAFKKYYQRTVYRCEEEYLSWLTEEKQYKGTKSEDEISLLVMGHSLDETDKDILIELFDTVSSITILYHNESSLRSLALNLVKMYGTDGLRELRTQKRLRFLPLSDDFANFLEERKRTHKTATERFVSTWLG